MSATIGIVPLMLQSRSKVHIVSPVAQRALKLFGIYRPNYAARITSLSNYQIYDDFTQSFTLSYMKDPTLVVVSPKLATYLPKFGKFARLQDFVKTERHQATWDNRPMIKSVPLDFKTSPSSLSAPAHLSPKFLESFMLRIGCAVL